MSEGDVEGEGEGSVLGVQVRRVHDLDAFEVLRTALVVLGPLLGAPDAGETAEGAGGEEGEHI